MLYGNQIHTANKSESLMIINKGSCPDVKIWALPFLD